MVGREARAKRATTAFNGGKFFFFFGLEKKKVSPFCFFPLSAKLAVCLIICRQRLLERQKKNKRAQLFSINDAIFLRKDTLG